MDVWTAAPATPRSVPLAQGWTWWLRAWHLFTRQPAWWVILGLVLMVILVLLSVLPVLGAFAAALLTPVFLAGLLQAARKVEGGGALEIGDLFAAFRGPQLNALLVLGALLMAATLLLGIVAGALGIGAVFGVAAGGMHGSVGGVVAGLGAGVLAMLVSLLFGSLLGMVFWFAPALVLFRGQSPMDAMKASFNATMKNLGPFVLYSAVYIVTAFAASVLFGLGWLVLVPVMLLTMYVSYTDVFGA